VADFDAFRNGRPVNEFDGDIVGMRLADIGARAAVPVGIVLGGQPE